MKTAGALALSVACVGLAARVGGTLLQAPSTGGGASANGATGAALVSAAPAAARHMDGSAVGVASAVPPAKTEPLVARPTAPSATTGASGGTDELAGAAAAPRTAETVGRAGDNAAPLAPDERLATRTDGGDGKSTDATANPDRSGGDNVQAREPPRHAGHKAKPRHVVRRQRTAPNAFGTRYTQQQWGYGHYSQWGYAPQAGWHPF